MIEPIPRTVEEPVKVGPLQAVDWVIVIASLLVPRFFETTLEKYVLSGIPLPWIVSAFFIALALLLLKIKSGKHRGYLASMFLYFFRPNRY